MYPSNPHQPTPPSTSTKALPFRPVVAALGVVALVIAGILAFARPTTASVTVVADEPAIEEPTEPAAAPIAVEPTPEPTVEPTPEPEVEPQPEPQPDPDPEPEPQPEPIDDFVAPEPEPEPIDDFVAPQPEPEPIDDIVTPTSECDGAFSMGRWDVAGAGTSGTAADLSVDTSGTCETVTITLDGAAPTVEVTRIPFLDWTMVRFDTGEVPMWPAPDLVIAGGDVVSGAVAFHDSFGPGLYVTHPIGLEVAADVTVDGDTVSVEFRESEPGDLTVDAGWGGEPYSQQMGGLPEDGLVVLLATELEGSGEIGVLGYARAPEANVVVRIWDGDTLLDETPLIAEGPADSYGRYDHRWFAPTNGTYTVEVGWDSPSDMDEFDVWYSTDVTVIGVP